MAHNCENCRLRARYDNNPNSLLGRFWRWHINFCPGWKKYFCSLTDKQKAEVRNRYDFHKYGDSKTTGGNAPQADESMLDDISYIRDMKHLTMTWQGTLWQQYDFLLAARKYGWEAMVYYADYLETADIKVIENLTTSEADLTEEYKHSKEGIAQFRMLTRESGSLGIGGYSDTLKTDIKIIWFNQTNVLRVFTHLDDETLMKKYVETLIRTSFGTKDAMKLAKPVPEDEAN